MPTGHQRSGAPPGPRHTIGESIGAYQAMRTVHALERLAFGPLSAPELAAALQIHTRTARRLLRRLQAEGYVTLLPGSRRRYRLTYHLAVLGRQAIARDDVLAVAAPWVAAVATQIRCRARLWIPCYTDVVCVLAAEPDGPIPEPALGGLAPAHATAPGKALLAHRERWRDSVLSGRLPRYTARTITDARDLSAELRRIRARGYAADAGEHDPAHRAIAAPVFCAGDAIAALATSGADACDTLTALLGATDELTDVLGQREASSQSATSGSP